jgi:hypothetical protein
MQGSLAQQIALTTYGNAYLSGVPGVDWTAFFPSNSTFSLCEYVRFVDRGGREAGAGDAPYAADPVEWFEKLSRDGVSRMRLACGVLPGEQHPRWFNEAMGSWNDVGFEGADREIYLQSSQKLSRALNEAVIVAANACSPPRGNVMATK